MAKGKGKKSIKKGKKVGQPSGKIKKVKIPGVGPSNTIVSAPSPIAGPLATSSDPASKITRDALNIKEKEKEKAKHLAGYIFMCNSSTKLECFRYRVFGLPLAKKEVVEGIQPGTKLFLFDFWSKLLYGAYEATSAGKLNLEPAAFKGQFPAQVKFRIFKECLPLPESSLRHVIKENYAGSKFNQELSEKIVRKLLSSFRPLTGSWYQSATQDLTNVSQLRARPPSVMENHFRTGLQYGSIPPSDQQHGYHRSAAYIERSELTLDRQGFPSSYYVPNPQEPYFTDGVAHGVQESLYSRYRTIEERGFQDQMTSWERSYILQRKAQFQGNVAVSNSNLTALPQYTSLVRRQQAQVPAPYHQYDNSLVTSNSSVAGPPQYTSLVTHQQALVTPPYHQYDNSVATSNSNMAAPPQYMSLVPPQQAQVPAAYHQMPSQRSTQYNNSVVACNTDPTAVAEYVPAHVSQPQVPATYHQVAEYVPAQVLATNHEVAEYVPAHVCEPQVPAAYHQVAEYVPAHVSQLQVPATYHQVAEYDPAQVSAQYASSGMNPQEIAPGVASQPHGPATTYYSYTPANQQPYD